MSSKMTIFKAAAGIAAAGALSAGAFIAFRSRWRDGGLRPAGKRTVGLPVYLVEAGFPLPEFPGIPAGMADMYSLSADGMAVWYEDVRRADLDAWLASLAAESTEGCGMRYRVEGDGSCFACADAGDPRRCFAVCLVSDADGLGRFGDGDVVEVDVPGSFFDAAGVSID